ncbi:hypothetical protein PanWU01x14_247600 [Parasponia andersonii]|uniref:Uncharacterized protein n=1 Tax=Parasponia andersonii TaxID=3476 RepID=A0A2P5BE05_PARAD|nr:hypothetical protein PanWU01x14_247600 [Parasponia andersonii]
MGAPRESRGTLGEPVEIPKLPSQSGLLHFGGSAYGAIVQGSWMYSFGMSFNMNPPAKAKDKK